MATLFDIITFDCYGTLIDWERGISDAFQLAGLNLDREEILRKYHDGEPAVEQDYRLYRDVLREMESRVAGFSTGFLTASLPDWKPFDDTNDALIRLKNAGYKLGILTNCDDDLIAATQKHFPVAFDLVVTAQQVKSYKPSPAHFTTAREKIGSSRWLHAAQSNFHDIVPTNAMNIPNAWINRKHEAALPGGIPGREFANLKGLAGWLAP